MSLVSLCESADGDIIFERRYIWELPVRLCHWAIALCIIVLFVTGLYMSYPVLTPRGEATWNFLMARVQQIHFAAAFVLMIAFLVRAYWFFAGNNYARSGFPIFWRKCWWRDLFCQIREYATHSVSEVHMGHIALAGLSYLLFVFFLGAAQILTGLALYSEANPGGFWDSVVGWVIPFLGGSLRVHVWHYLFSWGFLVFVILHVYIVIYDSQAYRNGLISSMISGYKFKKQGDRNSEGWIS